MITITSGLVGFSQCQLSQVIFDNTVIDFSLNRCDLINWT